MTSISLFILSSFSIHISSLAALLCYGITIIKEYEDATNTHCNVWNILPSFSSTIGNYTPQRYIWRLLVGLSCVMRLFSVWIFAQNLKRFKKRSAIINILTLMRVTEFAGLFLLTMFASTEIFEVHAFGFCIFFIFSTVNIFIVSRLMKHGITGSGEVNSRASLYPTIYFFTFTGCLISYILHDYYCWPGVYSVFGLLELLMIFVNIMFWFHNDCLNWRFYTISIE